MLVRAGLFALSLCLLGFTTRAVDLSIGLIVPYQINCVKQSDGTDQIRMRVLLRKVKKLLRVNEISQTSVINTIPSTHVLQSRAGCDVLDAMYAVDQKLYGYPALEVKTPATGTFVPGRTSLGIGEQGTLCAYLINVQECCGRDLEKLQEILLFEDADEVEWVDIGTLNANGSDTDVFALSQYSLDAMLTTAFFGVLPNKDSIRQVILRVAVDNLHGQKCCFETFGLDQDAHKGVMMQIMNHLMKGKDGSFTATGTFGSCGDTGSVTVTGNRTVQKRVSICGKDFCLTELPSVAATGNIIDSIQTSAPDGLSSRCFLSFLRDYLAFGLSLGVSGAPEFGVFGLEDELCRLIDGRKLSISQSPSVYKLHLLCLGDDTYGFAMTQAAGANNLLRILGCRFKLEECKKCCK